MDKAYVYLVKNVWMFDSIKVHRQDPVFALSVVFPEMIRYSTIQDKLELGGLFSLYVQYGKSYADFSVGHFQMKPSFAEQVENDAAKLKFSEFRYNCKNAEETRLERVKRLNSSLWQVSYLVAFLKIMDTRYQRKSWKSIRDKLQFYSAAYNCGYTLPEKEILRKLKLKTFYIGIIRVGEGFCYADLSCQCYTGLAGK